METTDVTETFAVLQDRLVIQFKKAGNDIQVYNVQKWTPGTNPQPAPVDVTPQLGTPNPPNGKFPVGALNKYIKNPTCICFEIGGSYYEICF